MRADDIHVITLSNSSLWLFALDHWIAGTVALAVCIAIAVVQK